MKPEYPRASKYSSTSLHASLELFRGGQHCNAYAGCLAAGFTEPEAVNDVDLSDAPQPQGIAALLQNAQKLFRRVQGDPFYAVISYRNFKIVP